MKHRECFFLHREARDLLRALLCVQNTQVIIISEHGKKRDNNIQQAGFPDCHTL